MRSLLVLALVAFVSFASVDDSNVEGDSPAGRFARWLKEENPRFAFAKRAETSRFARSSGNEEDKARFAFAKFAKRSAADEDSAIDEAARRFARDLLGRQKGFAFA